MMKRTGVPRLGPDEPTPLQSQSAQQIQANVSNMHTLTQQSQPILGTTAMLSVGGGGFGRTPPRPGAGGAGAAPAVINYLKAGSVQYAPQKQPSPQVPPRLKFEPPQAQLPPLPLERQSPAPVVGPGGPVVPGGPGGPGVPSGGPVGGPQAPPGAQFQRLKVEDALSYLDQVKYKFNTQPQVYNDFLDIMKEFKSQTIDTPGVITRVSNLFQGHPELIVGFNTFLPPGYKIEVQSNGQVSVSMPSPSGVMMGVHHPPPQPQLVHLLPVPQPVNNAMVHNLSVSAPQGNTLHQISQAHQQIEAGAIHHPPGNGGCPSASAPPGQPVEFNHAIEYVNKIKSRFSRQPDKYKRFLEILHAYQRGHRDVKEPQAKQQTEQEVYSQVAKLFENQDDLLAEFGQFLPDAKAVTKPGSERDRHYPHVNTPPLMPQPPVQQRVEPEPERYQPLPPQSPPHHLQHHPHAPQLSKHPSSGSSVVVPPVQQHHHLKRSPSFTSSGQMGAGAPLPKKPRMSSLTGATVRDVSYAEAAKLATLQDYSFFDRARKALRSQHVYENFLKCLLLFTNEIISSSELLAVTAPFLGRHPELQRWLQDFLGPPSPPHTPTGAVPAGYNNTTFNATSHNNNNATNNNNSLLSYSRTRRNSDCKSLRYEPIGPLGAQLRHDRPQGEVALDIDLTTCKRLGTSYCALPREYAARRCSGRTALCKEVLNDTWVSFPTWSEDSTFVTSRKTQYEEYIYRCEDERFELDVVIETNASTIRVLEGVQKKLSRMSPEDAAKFRLDECLGGHSPTIHQRALRRIYGDKAVDIIAGLKKNPMVAVPVVLRRLKAKEEEWREAQKGFNKQWREQNEKYYLKSLDHQGLTSKQNDLKALRSKALFAELEAAYAARRPPPHLRLDYGLRSRHEAIKILRDTAELLIHHARRQTAIQKAEKRRIKQLLRQFLPDLFSHPRQPLSDDERDEEKDEAASPGSPNADAITQDNEKNTTSSGVKQEIKQESSESDNASDKSGKNNKNNKENKPKNNNSEKDSNPSSVNSVKRSSSNEEQQTYKGDVKFDANDMEDDFRDYPPNEARFVCTSSWYLFLRVHACLCQRLAQARRTAQALAADPDHQRASVATALRLKPNNLPADVQSPSEYYNVLLDLVKGVLDGNMEPSAFEDAAREMLGIKAYPAYTLDKLVTIAVRQLQHVVSELWSVRAAELAARGGMRGPPSLARRAARYLRQGHHTAFLVKVYGGEECKVTFELLEGSGEGRTSPHHDSSRLSPTNQQRRPGPGNNDEAVVRLGAWSLYTERFARPGTGQGPTSSESVPRAKPVFLVRNARARGDGFSHNAHAHAAAAPPTSPASAASAAVPRRRARRKQPPPRMHDASECTLSANLKCRAVALRPFQLYQPGALAQARATHARLHEARRLRFRAWLRLRRHDL